MEEANNQPFRCTKSYRIKDIEITSGKAPDMLGYTFPKPRIILTFSYNHIYNTLIQAQDDLQQLLDVHSPTFPLILTAVDLTRKQLFCSKRSHKIIRKGIKDWHLDKNIRRQLIKTSLETARKALKSIPKGHDSLYLETPLVVEHDHIFPEGSRRLIEESNGMTSADESWIESLENRLVASDGNCVISKEDYNHWREKNLMPHCMCIR